MQSSLGGNTPEFYQTWANVTVPPPQWDVGIFSFHFSYFNFFSIFFNFFSLSSQYMIVSEGSTTGSGISLSSAEMLFDSKQPFSLTNSDQSSYQLWGKAVGRHQVRFLFFSSFPLFIFFSYLFVCLSNFVGKHNLNNTAEISFIMELFALDERQANMVINWLQGYFYPNLVDPSLVAHHKVFTLYDLAYLQWGHARFFFFIFSFFHFFIFHFSFFIFHFSFL